ncbi:hypothetical protein C8R46DRAFT_1065502, partial [Mycena filopes]
MTATPPQPAMLLRALTSLAAVLVGVQVIRTVYQSFRWHFFSEFSRIPGPPSHSWRWGILRRLLLRKLKNGKQSIKFSRDVFLVQIWVLTRNSGYTAVYHRYPRLAPDR